MELVSARLQLNRAAVAFHGRSATRLNHETVLTYLQKNPAGGVSRPEPLSGHFAEG